MVDVNTTSTRRPRLVVFAGPNGSGKSTATKMNLLAGAYINADDIKVLEDCSDLEAAQKATQLREAALAGLRDFTFETVLSTDRNLDLIRRAKEAGYHITTIFVLTADPAINVYRISNRIVMGGHPVPPDRIRSRYTKSLANLPELAALSDSITIFDNSLATPQVIYRRDANRDAVCPNDVWAEAAIWRLLGRADT